MLISLLIVVVILGLLLWLIEQLPLAPPFKLAARVILVIILILWLVQFLPAGHSWRGFCG